MRDKEETASEASWTVLTKGKEQEVWRLEPGCEAETSDATASWSGVKGVSVNGQARAKMARMENKIKQKWKRR